MSAAPSSGQPSFLRSPYLLWILLALPVIVIANWPAITGGKGEYLRNTGLVSCWLLIVTLAVTPLAQMFGPQPWVRWLRTNRRYLGVASFGYGLLHLAAFIVNTNPQRFLGTFTRWEILTGWLGFFVMAAMAITSNDRSVRQMGRGWKRLQQVIYLGAPLVLVHWLFSEKHYLEVAIYSVPLILLMIWRLLRRRTTA